MVCDAAIRRDKAFIPNISVLWKEGAEVFVRVNSKGTPLNQADFILT